MPNNRTSGYAKSILYCVILNERAKQDSSKFLSLDIFYFFFCLSGKCIINPSLWSKMDLILSRAGWYFVIMTVNSVSFASFTVQWLYYARVYFRRHFRLACNRFLRWRLSSVIMSRFCFVLPWDMEMQSIFVNFS